MARAGQPVSKFLHAIRRANLDLAVAGARPARLRPDACMIGTLKVYVRMYALRARRAARRDRNRRLLARGRPDWIVTLNSPRNGLFAHLTWCLTFWRRAELEHRRITVRGLSPQYSGGRRESDWFQALFLNRRPAFDGDDATHLLLREYEEWPNYHAGAGLRSLAEAAALFRKFSGLQPALVSEVERFCADHWGRGPVLGVHYRGTDKHAEAPPVSAAAMIGHVRAATTLWPELRTIFVASDEKHFPAALRAALPGHRVICAENALRSTGRRAVHHLKGADGLRRAHEAVFDAVVLSKTSLLLKTASMLSGWSAVFAPDLPTILVNPPHARANFFPDCLLRHRVADLPAVVAEVRAKR